MPGADLFCKGFTPGVWFLNSLKDFLLSKFIISTGSGDYKILCTPDEYLIDPISDLLSTHQVHKYFKRLEKFRLTELN